MTWVPSFPHRGWLGARIARKLASLRRGKPAELSTVIDQAEWDMAAVRREVAEAMVRRQAGT